MLFLRSKLRNIMKVLYNLFTNHSGHSNLELFLEV